MWTLGHIRMDAGWRRKHVRKKGYETGDQADDGGTGEDGEEKSPTNDERVSIADMSILLDAMRAEQNETLAQGRFYQASQTQQAIMTFLTASSGRNPVGMSMLVTWIRGVFQRLYCYSKNRGSDERATAYRRYVDDLHGVMNGSYLWENLEVAWISRDNVWRICLIKAVAEQRTLAIAHALEEECERTWCPLMHKDDTHKSKLNSAVVLISMACTARQDPELVSPLWRKTALTACVSSRYWKLVALLPGMSERKWTKLWAERIGSKWVAGWTESSRETNGVVGCSHMSLA